MAQYEYRKRSTYAGVKIDIKAHTEEDIGIKYARKVDAIEKGNITTGGSTTVNRWAEIYFDKYVAEKVSAGVLRDRQGMYRNHIRPQIGAMKIRDVTAGHCQIIINSMRGMSRDRIDKGCQLLFNIFKKAKSEKMIFENPADDLIRPPADNGHRRSITMQERAFTLMCADNHRAGLWIKAILLCGFRPAETERFKGKHINYDEGLIFIDGTKSYAAKRIVPAPPALLNELKKLNRGPDEYIFQNLNANRLHKSSRQVLWNNFKREMNIRAGCTVVRNQVMEPYAMADDLVPYCYRHTFATDLKDAQIPFSIRQELLGHAGDTVTDGYTHRTETSLRIAANFLEKYRREQEIEIKSMQERIQRVGYFKEEVIKEDLTHKFFPNL